MNDHSESIKTGQHIDRQKQEVLLPHLFSLIMRNLPEKERLLSVMDIGTGDASFFMELLKQLSKQGKKISEVTMVDLGKNVLPSLVTAGATLTKKKISVAIVEPFIASNVGPDLNQYEERFDLALSTLTLHQIENPALITLYLCRLFMALKADHCCHLTDLHPKYLAYLSEHVPEKFQFTTETSGTFTFDSGGQAEVSIYPVNLLHAWAVAVGFKLESFTLPSIHSIVEHKSRYKKMEKEGIPLFYTLALRKDPHRSFHYSEGYVESSTRNDNRLSLTFSDNEEVSFPWPNNKEIQMNKGDYVHLLQPETPTTNPRLFLTFGSQTRRNLNRYNTIN